MHIYLLPTARNDFIDLNSHICAMHPQLKVNGIDGSSTNKDLGHMMVMTFYHVLRLYWPII